MAKLQSGTRIYGNATIDTVLHVDGSDATTSNATGALQVAGGIGAKGNIFTSGTLTATTGNITTLNATDATITGNLVVNGNTIYANVTTLNIKDPIIEQGGYTNGDPLTSNDGLDRGQLLHYYDSGAKDAFMGWKRSSNEFVFASNVTVTDNVVTVNNLGNIKAGNANLGNTVTANYFVGDGSMLTGVIATGGGSQSYVVSNIGDVVPGSTIAVDVSYANATYPGGLFTIYQLGPVTLTASDIWASGGTSKNQYANYLASSVNTQDISLTLALANATFDIKSTDTITVGVSTITGSNLANIGITGNSGTYTIPSSYFTSSIQTSTPVGVSVSLTTSRGKYTSAGTTLTTVAPTQFNVNNIAVSWPFATVPYWSLNQSFHYNISRTGTVLSGNLYYGIKDSGTYTTSLSSAGDVSGNSPSLDSTVAYTVTTSDYHGNGLNGYGESTIASAVTGNVAAATKYYPIFYKTTSSSTVPSFTSSDGHGAVNYATGQGANTTNVTTNYTWIATPNSTSHTWGYTFLGSIVGQDPAVAGTEITIEGHTYTVYGFTDFSAVTFLYTLT